MEFLTRPDYEVLVLYMSSSGQLTPQIGYPSGLKSKACFFYRKEKEVITPENMKDILLFGDLPTKPVEALSVLVDQVEELS